MREYESGFNLNTRDDKGPASIDEGRRAVEHARDDHGLVGTASDDLDTHFFRLSKR